MQGKQLTEVAQAERIQFLNEYGDGNCSCHIKPPCPSCSHPGNPANQAEDESCWEPEPSEETINLFDIKTDQVVSSPPPPEEGFNPSGSKYLRKVPCAINGRIDVYAVVDAFKVTCPARQHAIKKLLCSGIRGKGDALQDLNEARDAVDRAIQMEQAKGAVSAAELAQAQFAEMQMRAGRSAPQTKESSLD